MMARATVLRNGSFRRLWGAQFTAIAATNAFFFVSMTLVEELTHSSAPMGVMIFSVTMPGLLFSLLAGVVVDRQERVRVLATCHGLRALLTAGFLLAVRFLPLAWLLLVVYVVNFSLSALVQLVSTAEGATVPHLVGNEQLLSANYLLTLSSALAQGGAWVVLAPPLLKAGGPQLVALVVTILSLIALALVIRLPREEILLSRKKERSPARLWADFRAGWRYASRDRLVLLAIGQLVLALGSVLALSTLAPGFVARVLGIDVENAVYLMLPVGVGYGLGLLLMGRTERQHRPGKQPSGSAPSLASEDTKPSPVPSTVVWHSLWGHIGLAVLGGSLLLITPLRRLDVPGLLLFLAAAAGMGLGLSLTTIPTKVVLQERPPVEMRGRVIAAQLTLVNAVSALFPPLVGWMADHLGIRRVLCLGGLTVLGMTGASLPLLLRAFRRKD